LISGWPQAILQPFCQRDLTDTKIEMIAPAPRFSATTCAVGWALAAALAAGLVFAPADSTAQPAPATTAARPAVSSPRASASAPAVKPSFPRPTWAQLTVQQQVALLPLASVWDPLSEAQKRKWLEISKNHPALPAEDQARMHSRMVEWVGMSPQQRAQARLNFAQTQELSTPLSADEKKAKWQSYQALSADEKEKLARKAAPKPTGAATAIRPVAPEKLAATSAPAAPRANRAETKITPLLPMETR
jgi:Protein of unknown function (DUF3106)